MPATDLNEIKLSEVIAALSYALDLTEGQPMGHSVRSCLIGMRLAAELELGRDERSALFYALLLKDAGCSSNAAKISALFAADDRAVKRDRKTTYWPSPGESLRHVARTARPDGSVLARARQIATVSRSGAEGARQLTEIRCERGAEIALMLELSPPTAEAIRALDEHWDGRGYPDGLAGEEIPLLGRILGLAQTVEVFFSEYGRAAAYGMAEERRGTWFDPALVDVLGRIEDDRAFWDGLASPDGGLHVAAVEPADRTRPADPDALDRVAEAFAKVVDAKSPYTYRHSEGVAEIAVGIGAVLDLSADDLRDLRRAALLHDIGKLGVSNLILDKPGRLTDEEWVAMRRHPEYTKLILERVPAFRDLAEVASAHHERLDGSGYHRGLAASQLSVPARILAVADVCEALSAERPYRAALPPEEVLAIMRRDAGTALCPTCFEALEDSLAVRVREAARAERTAAA